MGKPPISAMGDWPRWCWWSGGWSLVLICLLVCAAVSVDADDAPQILRMDSAGASGARMLAVVSRNVASVQQYKRSTESAATHLGETPEAESEKKTSKVLEYGAQVRDAQMAIAASKARSNQLTKNELMSKGKLSEMEKVTLRREKTHKNEAHTQREENREKFRSKDKMYENMRKAKVKNTRKYQVNEHGSKSAVHSKMLAKRKANTEDPATAADRKKEANLMLAKNKEGRTKLNEKTTEFRISLQQKGVKEKEEKDIEQKKLLVKQKEDAELGKKEDEKGKAAATKAEISLKKTAKASVEAAKIAKREHERLSKTAEKDLKAAKVAQIAREKQKKIEEANAKTKEKAVKRVQAEQVEKTRVAEKQHKKKSGGDGREESRESAEDSGEGDVS